MRNENENALIDIVKRQILDFNNKVTNSKEKTKLLEAVYKIIDATKEHTLVKDCRQIIKMIADFYINGMIFINN